MHNSLSELIPVIKEKKELKHIADTIVLRSLQKYFTKKHIDVGTLKNLRLREVKVIVKDIRAELRYLTGQFHRSAPFPSFSQQLSVEAIFQKHQSTRERLDFYPRLRHIIQEKKIHSLLDLGCGLNPLALATHDFVYYAVDIQEEEIAFVNRFFEEKKINGKAWIYDIRHFDARDFPTIDLCLLLKVIDLIEQRGHKLAEHIIKTVLCKYLLISFSTKTISGKPMRHPQRGWIERLLTRLDYSFQQIPSKNEIFYLAQKY